MTIYWNIAATCIEGTVRLLVGNDYAYYYGEVNSDYGYTYIKDTLSQGRVQICIGGEYTRVCADLWDDQDASVVCRELGFSPYGELARIVFLDTYCHEILQACQIEHWICD